MNDSNTMNINAFLSKTLIFRRNKMGIWDSIKKTTNKVVNETKNVTNQAIDQIKKETKELDDIYPVYMTKDLRSDELNSIIHYVIRNNLIRYLI